MPLYSVDCADKATGHTYTVKVRAESPREAAADVAAEANAKGHLVGRVRQEVEVSDLQEAIAGTNDELHKLRAELSLMAKGLESLPAIAASTHRLQRLWRAPVMTIAAGIVIGMVLWLLLVWIVNLVAGGFLRAIFS
jgi:hypothetical protein